MYDNDWLLRTLYPHLFGTADSKKVALGIGNCALGRYCLVFTRVKD